MIANLSFACSYALDPKVATGIKSCDVVPDLLIDQYFLGIFNVTNSTANSSLGTCLGNLSYVRQNFTRLLVQIYTTSGDPLIYTTKNPCYNDKSPSLTGSQLSFRGLPRDYQSNITSWYNGTYQDPNDQMGHIQCNTGLAFLTASGMLEGLDLLMHQMSLVVKSPDLTAFRSNIVLLNASARGLGIFETGFAKNVTTYWDDCKWTDQFKYPCPIDKDTRMKYSHYLTSLTEIPEKFDKMLKRIGTFRSVFLRVQQVFLEGLYAGLSNKIIAYEMENITKLQLAEHLTTYSFKKELQDLSTLVDSALGEMDNVKEKGDSLYSHVAEIFEQLFAFEIPLLNDHLLMESDFFKKIFTKSTGLEVQGYISSLTTAHNIFTARILDAHCDPYTGSMLKTKGDLAQISDYLFGQVESYTNHLKAYKESAITGDDFFV